MEKKEIKKYLVVAILLILSYIAYLIIAPFIAAILASFILAYLFFPIFKKLKEKTKNEVLSAAITTIIMIIVILLPIFLIANALITESIDLVRSGKIEQLENQLETYLTKETTVSNFIDDAVSKTVNYLRGQATTLITSFLSQIFNLLIIIYATFAFLMLGEKLVHKGKKILPIKEKDQLIKHIGDTTYSIVYGLFVTAIVEFIIALIIFKIIGSSAALLLALVIGFLAFIPLLGPGLVYIPYAIIEFLNKDYLAFVLLLVMGVIFFVIENVIRPKIIGKRTSVHPVIILIGTFGGIKLLGVIGIVIGPIVLSTIITVIKEYYPEITKDEA